MPAAHCIAVHAPDACVRKDLLQALLSLLRSRAEKIQMLALALGAELGHGAPVAAVMALQPLSDMGVLVIRMHRLVVLQSDRAVLALQPLAAGPAHHHE